MPAVTTQESRVTDDGTVEGVAERQIQRTIKLLSFPVPEFSDIKTSIVLLLSFVLCVIVAPFFLSRGLLLQSRQQLGSLQPVIEMEEVVKPDNTLKGRLLRLVS
ncbi:hypothetical protein ACFL11_01270 [Patescibacteria group bacterium]